MQRIASSVLVAVSLVGCLTADPTDDSDPDLDGKADSAASATAKGALVWGDQDIAFGSATLVYYTFELSGAADVTFETAKAGSDLDTVLYLLQPSGDRWGAYLAKNDHGGDASFSKLVQR